ncbi:uncharacterized protein LOC112595047 [Melanaphis sacchari]|uniref:uncharacterized protein LOC112595047 n=1 Tax=Melanaphis sacchari TaxID=742174 RepID=UPI000DC13D31|nr:uncharacterized protein LOC112595047 [Melanaphis sacchari]
MPCREVRPTAVQHYRQYDDDDNNDSDQDDNNDNDHDDDGSSGKTTDSDSNCSGRDETAAEVRACSRSKWLKTLRTVIGKMEGGGGRRPRQVKTILRPPTTYVFVIGMSGLPSKVAVYPRWT